jgi:hypothetical protein
MKPSTKLAVLPLQSPTRLTSKVMNLKARSEQHTFCACKWYAIAPSFLPVSRIRSSLHFAAPSGANFGFEGTLEILDSSVVWFRNSLEELAATDEGNF